MLKSLSGNLLVLFNLWTYVKHKDQFSKSVCSYGYKMPKLEKGHNFPMKRSAVEKITSAYFYAYFKVEQKLSEDNKACHMGA